MEASEELLVLDGGSAEIQPKLGVEMLERKSGQVSSAELRTLLGKKWKPETCDGDFLWMNLIP